MIECAGSVKDAVHAVHIVNRIECAAGQRGWDGGSRMMILGAKEHELTTNHVSTNSCMSGCRMRGCLEKLGGAAEVQPQCEGRAIHV